MFDIFLKLMLFKRMSFEPGNIKIFNQDIIMGPVTTFVKLYKILENYNVENSLYYSAKEAGKEWFDKMYIDFKIKHKEIFRWGSNLIALGGWGVVEMLLEDKEDTTMWKLHNSTFAKTYLKLYGKPSKPVDVIFRGYVTGAMQHVYNEDMEGIETECIALGSPSCTFVVKKKSKIDINDLFVKSQLEFKNSLDIKF